ncbi:phosphate ABC transporter substrate-binding protein [Billgrantia antri]|uniref:Phosphate ABC transporter substrate-binding protein n=1 Tax=Halomonas sulfidivorans TaxID=2733488 RepID=A0ABX7WJB4_9GAMM|nr:phosphate ABC transporter substrate-binding protein [Halomonas sulfidivorans]QTP60518.1 phosphate ABC transporter substrate-binding protein [Halomonas sulfidivorans]
MPSRLKRTGCGLLFSLASSMAWAEVVVVVSAHNPLVTLTRSELADIYLGRTSRFPNGQPATPLDQGESSPIYATFYREYLGQTPTQVKMHWSRLIFTGRGQPPRSLAGDRAMVDFVAAHADAIGYLDDVHIDERLRVVTID